MIDYGSIWGFRMRACRCPLDDGHAGQGHSNSGQPSSLCCTLRNSVDDKISLWIWARFEHNTASTSIGDWLMICSTLAREGFMRFICILGLVAGLSSCNSSHRESDGASRNEQDRKSAAFKAGEVAHDLSKEAGKAAKAAGKEVGKEAHELREGWKEAQREDRARKQTTGR